MAALCLLGTTIFASAAPATSSKAAGEFGTIRGYLGDSWAQVPSGVLQYGFTYNTTVTKSPSSTAKIYAYLIDEYKQKSDDRIVNQLQSIL